MRAKRNNILRTTTSFWHSARHDAHHLGRSLARNATINECKFEMLSAKEALSVKNQMLNWDKVNGQYGTFTFFAPIFANV